MCDITASATTEIFFSGISTVTVFLTLYTLTGPPAVSYTSTSVHWVIEARDQVFQRLLLGEVFVDLESQTQLFTSATVSSTLS